MTTEERIAKLKQEIKCEEEKLKCCATSKSDLMYLYSLEEELHNLEEIEEDDVSTEMTLLYNAIIKWFDDALEDWGSIDNPDWIHYVCKEIGITQAEYKSIMGV